MHWDTETNLDDNKEVDASVYMKTLVKETVQLHRILVRFTFSEDIKVRLASFPVTHTHQSPFSVKFSTLLTHGWSKNIQNLKSTPVLVKIGSLRSVWVMERRFVAWCFG